ncbi:inositol 1,4,5-triphosphate receptor associated 2 isoform X1 [Carassius carassius]|uniref:inositol 1,4,5-triphosphate receptor associated 2 isoform X1 n=2 Tax=Carassius carassius TaxID=217509 RepID=UPI0028690C30|nr:inositol 1,4,5-triphosphate receptor associated 2 isoform X1 [Carassius carassius]XP_059367170.1 inositol 1,4,5-triphosphate receptor associated 2 isoform X1 [Carassius carassius]XP_059367171.1 inositol 1,4,5-triphosphate receptor associated 2 isoform X1 [Carassius carassius]XP_059367172.1 inositol 1,4,5-triphosphate receptor associated 2 isoform X1 [Carassius carassius]
MDIGVTPRRHNPVDSICRKLQTIQRRDQEVNSPFQIPKFQSSSYDSPHSGLRLNLEAILKKRTVRTDGDSDCDSSVSMLTPTASPGPGSAANTPRAPITPGNATYTITSTLSTLGERRNTATYSRPFRRNCSTPATQTGDNYFNFTPRYSTQTLLEGPETEVKTSKIPAPGLFSYNLNFSSDISNMDSELTYPALVVKRLSLGEGSMFPSEPKKESMAEVSLICEEDLLDTIFQACDTQCRGKVYVSHIVDFLRHTTCRSSEDSGLEELCNMLDPEHKDISIDLDTYHAIMKEWIDDCRKQGKDSKNDTQQESFKLWDSLSARRSALLNMTSGSLEAFGGEASRADLETSDLVFCVADLQLNNQKLQEEVRKLKQAVESMEDTNQRLIEENEDLKAQARIGQQLLQKEKMLKEEVEEMKLSLTSSEECRAQASAQRRQMERENQSLISKIAALQEENMKVTLEAEDLQKKINDLCDLNADLQVQVHSFDTILADKESIIQEKNKQIDELKVAIVEYSSVTELLRADKNKLESQMQMMQPDMTIPGLSLSVAYRLNQMSSGSLQTELAMAQNPLEGLEHLSSSVCFASSLDETLDREVLLLLQGPTPEQLSLEFKTLISRLKREFKEDGITCLIAFRSLTENSETHEINTDLKIQGLEVQLEQRRSDWTRSLEQLDQYTDSLERELLKMASNMRRSRTEILHLSVKVQEQENQKQQLREELDQLKVPLDIREASSQTPDHLQQVVEELDGPCLEWDEEYVLSESPPLQELGPDQEMLQELCCEEEVLQALKQEEEEEVEHTETVRDKEKITERTEEEGEAMQDSGVENEELQRDSILSQMPLPDDTPDRESQGTPFVGEEGMQRPCTALKEEDRLPECTGPEYAHEQAAPLLHTHSQCADASLSSETPREQVTSVKHLISSTEPSSLENTEMVSLSAGQPEVGDSITGRTQQPTATNGESEGEPVATTAYMSDSQRLSEGQLSKVSVKSDKSPLLPVAEEEEAMPEAAEAISTGVNSPASADSLKDPYEKAKDMTFDPVVSEGNLPTVPAAQGSKKDPLTLMNKLKKEISSMAAIEEQKAQEDGEPSVGTEKEGGTSVISENASDSTKDVKNSLSPSDKEIEAEFHRLSLGFKCDTFTLEKRLRLEERSRDLAEENVRKEVNSCIGLLQALIPRCEEDNQSMEIIHRLQKNLEVLIQSMTRVSSRSEMLGAVHQETRVGKTVEVMIQHVENLRRMYTKEHAELLELRENLTPNERSFGSHTERDDFRNKKPSTGNIFKNTSRRISIATIPRSIGGQTHFDMPKDMAETEVERLSRRSPWNMATKRPPLKRFISSGTWANIDEPTLMNSPSPSPTDHAPPSLTDGRPAVSRGTRGIWIWLALLVVLVVLLALLASLMLQPAVDAAPVGTGDSWMTIQQLLWPYTGLRHNGQPPV